MPARTWQASTGRAFVGRLETGDDLVAELEAVCGEHGIRAAWVSVIGAVRRASFAYYQQAEEAIARSLQLSPGNREAQKMRVWALLGKHEFAETTLRQGMIRAPERADIVLALAQLLEKEGRTNESLELYRRILNLAPHSPEAEQARTKVGR